MNAKTVECTYTVHAVIFGADESLLRDALLKSLYLSESKDQRITRLKQVVANNLWLSGK